MLPQNQNSRSRWWTSVDLSVFNHLFAISTRYRLVGRVFVVMTRLSSPVFAVAYLRGIFTLILGPSWQLAPFLVGPALTLLSVNLIRLVYERPRPYMATNQEPLIDQSVSASFPSRHAASAFSIAIAICHVNPVIGAKLVLLAGITGLSRVMVGVHFPLDIVAGAALAYLITSAVFIIARYLGIN